MSHRHLMSREEPVMCQTCGETLTVKHLLIYCQNRIMETRKSLEMSDNLRSPIQNNINKNITFIKLIDIYNLIKGNHIVLLTCN